MGCPKFMYFLGEIQQFLIDLNLYAADVSGADLKTDLAAIRSFKNVDIKSCMSAKAVVAPATKAAAAAKTTGKAAAKGKINVKIPSVKINAKAKIAAKPKVAAKAKISAKPK